MTKPRTQGLRPGLICAPAPEFSIKDQSPIPAVLKMNLTLPVAPEAMPEKLL